MYRRLAPLLAVVVVVAGCSGNPTEPPPPTTSTPTTTSATIDLRPFYEHPCTMLTAAQRRRLGFPPRVRERAGESASMCTWSQNDDDNYLLSFNLGSDALAEAYKKKDERDPDGELLWKSFQPQEIRGLGAVARSFDTIGSHCEVIVDFGGGQSISVTGSLLTAPDPKLCDRLVTAAGFAVDAARR